MFENLREGQSVKVGNRYAAKLATGKYRIDGDITDITIPGIYMISSLESVEISRAISAKISHFIDHSTEELISKEEYESALEEEKSYGGQYPDISTEIMVRENLRRFSNYEKVMTPKHFRYEIMKLTVDAEVVDTGSEFIESVLETGNLKYPKNVYDREEEGMFKVFNRQIAYTVIDQYPELNISSGTTHKSNAGGREIDLPTLTQNDKPIFTPNDRVEFRKMLGEYSVHFTLEEAKKAENEVREFYKRVFDRILVKTSVGERFKLTELSDKIREIEFRFHKLDVKRNDEAARRVICGEVRALRERIDAEIENDIKKAS